MALSNAIAIVRETGHMTISPADNGTLSAGHGVVAAAAGRGAISGADAELFLGVALQDCVAPEDLVTTASTSGVRAVLNMAPLPTSTVLAGPGDTVPVVFAADCGFGALVKCAASGEFTPWAKATDKVETLVGRCVQPAGVDVSDNKVGLLRIGL